MVLTGQRTLVSLAYRYDTLLNAYAVQVIQEDVTEIDPVGVKDKRASGVRSKCRSNRDGHGH